MKPLIKLIFVTGSLLPTVASATLLSQDSFSAYPAGKLPEIIPSPDITGYVGNWTAVDFGSAWPAVTAGTLTYPGANYVQGSGSKVSIATNITGGEITAANSGRTYRLLDGDLTVTDATETTLYLSLLFQTGQETGATTYQMLSLYNASTSDANRNFDIGITNNGGLPGTSYSFGADNSYTSTGVTADTSVHLLVVKFVLSATAASDSVTVWVDPDLSAGEPSGGTSVSGKDLTWDRLVFSDYDGNSCSWDEIRWGTTFESTTTESFLPAIPTFNAGTPDYFGLVGDDVQLVADASADPAPTYQWEYSPDDTTYSVVSGANVSGATSSTLTITDAAFARNGYYRATATNANGSDTSSPALVSLVYPAPVIITQPTSVNAETGSTVELSVVANGLGTLSYKWYKDLDFEPIPGETSNTLTLVNVNAGDEGDYYAEVTDHAAEDDGQLPTTSFSSIATVTLTEPWNGLVSHDPFSTSAGYALGALDTQNPTIVGYMDPWAITDGFGPISPVVSSGSLIYPDPLYLGSSGEMVSTPADAAGIDATNSGRVGRLLEPDLKENGGTTGTRYISWLFRSGFENAAPQPQVYQTLALFNGNIGTDGNRDFEAGIASGDFGTNNFAFRLNNNAALIGNLGVPSDGNVHLFVAKFELSSAPGGDSVTVWIDPTLGSGDPTGGVTVTGADLLWDRLAFSDYASDSSNWDELRWGSDFDSVTLGSGSGSDYASWIALYPGVGAETGFDEDADDDGIENGLENFFGTDPSVSNPGIVQVTSNGTGVLTFRHPQNAMPASDITAAYRWSTDLVTWNANGASSGGSTVSILTSPNTPVAGTTEVTATATTSPGRLFIDLQVSKAP
jgi:hypothetical protein